MRELVHVQGGQCAWGKNGPPAQNRELSILGLGFGVPAATGLYGSRSANCSVRTPVVDSTNKRPRTLDPHFPESKRKHVAWRSGGNSPLPA